jgi:hypothetical protein
MKIMTREDKMKLVVFGAFMTTAIVLALYNSLTIGTECGLLIAR